MAISILGGDGVFDDKKPGHSFVQFIGFSTTTSGAGAVSGLSTGGFLTTAPTTAIGHGIGSFSYAPAQRGLNRGNGSWNWSKRFTATFRYARLTAATDSNSISRVTFGKAATAAGDLTLQGVGIKMTASNALQLIVHNGTNFTAVTTTSNIIPTVPITTDIRITSDGAGNVSLYVNDVLEASTSAGPTNASATASASLFMTEAENAAIITGSPVSHVIYNLHFEFDN